MKVPYCRRRQRTASVTPVGGETGREGGNQAWLTGDLGCSRAAVGYPPAASEVLSITSL